MRGLEDYHNTTWRKAELNGNEGKMPGHKKSPPALSKTAGRGGEWKKLRGHRESGSKTYLAEEKMPAIFVEVFRESNVRERAAHSKSLKGRSIETVTT